MTKEDLGFKSPFTLGYENAGWVDMIGQGVTGFKKATPSAFGVAAAAQRSSESMMVF